jgi:uncharacterized protein YlxP (DUF503 family)
MAHVALLTLQFHLPACGSLKEKRQRLARLRDRFGREPSLAVCESDWQDVWDRAQWSFLAMATDRQFVERQLQAVERFAAEELDAVVTNAEREWL